MAAEAGEHRGAGTIGADGERMRPGFEYAFELRVEVDPEIPLGGSDPGEGLHFTPISGGDFDGPLLRGTVRPGGGDWWVGTGLVCRLDARYVIDAEVAEGIASVDVVNRGYWRTDAASAERLEAGEHVDETRLYYRTAFVFQTAHPELQWLAASQFVGYARPGPGTVVIRVFRLL